MVQGQEARGQRSPLIAEEVPVSQNGPLQDSTAYDILALLAKELPKLVNAQMNRSTSHSCPNNEQPSKRRRVNSETDHVTTTSLEESPILPSLDLLDVIISAYFTHIHPCIPMIHQARFRRRLGDMNDSATLEVILHAMIVSSSKFVPHANISPDLIRCSRKWVVSTAMELVCLEGLQALIILAFTDVPLTPSIPFRSLHDLTQADWKRKSCKSLVLDRLTHPHRGIQSAITRARR